MKHFYLLIGLFFITHFSQAFEAANDTCATATNITVTTTLQAIAIDINNANLNLTSACSGSSNALYADVWFSFTMPNQEVLVINGQSSINRFALYNSCGGTEIACFFNSNTISGLVPGNVYKLRVFRSNLNAGTANYLNVLIKAETPIVTIPDANFKACLLVQSAINTNGDSEIQVSEASAFTGTITCNSMNISNMTGIEAFTSLTKLNCNFNQLTSLNLSANTLLTDIGCSNNQLTSLDLSNNTQLKALICRNNQFTTLNTDSNTLLKTIDCSSNNINSLNVSNNTALEVINCGNNNLSSIEVSNNELLGYLNVSNNNISLLNVSNNSALTQLVCSQNNIVSLDLSNNPNLFDVNCFSNALTSLNVKNGNNTSITSFFASGNPNLYCIKVDDTAYSQTNWTSIDDQSGFSEDCNYSCDDSKSITLSSSFTIIELDDNPEIASNYQTDCGTSMCYNFWYDFTMPYEGNVIVQGLSVGVPEIHFAIYDTCDNTTNYFNNSYDFAYELIPGNTYKLKVYKNVDAVEDDSFRIRVAPRPANDVCDEAANINLTTSYQTQFIPNIMGSAVSIENSNSYVSIWYKFVMPFDGSIAIPYSGPHNYFALKDNCNSQNNYSPTLTGSDMRVYNGLIGENTYYLRVYRNATSAIIPSYFDFDIKAVEKPQNDDCTSSETINVSTSSSTVNFSILGANVDNVTFCEETSPALYADIWYSFTMPVDGNVIISENSDINLMTLYDVCNGSLLGCFSDNGSFENLIANTNYKLQVLRKSDFLSYSTTSDNFNITVESTLGVQEITNNNIKLYPNPTSDYINISSQTPIIEIDMYDVLGKHVLSTSQTTQIDVSQLTSGLYFVKIQSDKGEIIKKIIIE
uniref:T9SS type A sorting domain-containing protein n=1 Tax=Gelidibacter sp. TaxID=2018083 RepID=UPI004048ED3F